MSAYKKNSFRSGKIRTEDYTTAVEKNGCCNISLSCSVLAFESCSKVKKRFEENLVYTSEFMKLRIIPIILICVALFTGCSERTQQSQTVEADVPKLEYASFSDLSKVKRFAILSGTIYGDIIKEMYPQAEVMYFSSAVDCALSVAKNKADATMYDAPILQYIADSTAGVDVMPGFLLKDNYHFCLGKTERGEMLKKEFDEWLAIQKQNGEIDRLYDFWCSNKEPEQIFDFSNLPETNGKIIIATGPGSRPSVYYSNNMLTGFPIELIYKFCLDKGYGGEIIIASDSVLAMLQTGKADISVGFTSYTEERAESILFSNPVLESGVAVLVRSAEKEERTLWTVIKDGIEKTFIRENRWKLLVDGLKTAIIITLGGFFLANLLGAAFCSFAMSKHKWLRVVSDVYDRIIQGTPMVVILMILYYVIFGDSDISRNWIAIIAFGLTSGASLARQFHVSIRSVDKGQIEAGLALGFSKVRTFTGIVFPQAARMILPGYFSEIIGLMKGTSIVGYISIVDLTRAGDLIRSSTYDAFFPLLSVAFVYFLISFGLLCLLKIFQKKLAPKRYVAKKDSTK